ncbi:glycoprotein 3-alpha-L-fucosyltransferase A [Octopus sinensis]|uniref:Fucosyltransferase n=1 Tax=Octopus sinensis TaxID=2607531 RepID=A0A6P7SDB4_9MOLL|nr:glycoprotein 3-alpha-L-fucosyltransferase A [Octopus sinensis]
MKTMKLSIKKAFTWVFFASILFLIIFNLYNHKLWVHTYSAHNDDGSGYSSNIPKHRPADHKNILTYQGAIHDKPSSLSSLLVGSIKKKGQHVQNKISNIRNVINATRHYRNNSMTSEFLALWPGNIWDVGDRIQAQLKYIPPNYIPDKYPRKQPEEINGGNFRLRDETGQKKEPAHVMRKLKTILIYNGFSVFQQKHGQDTFLDYKCPINTCYLTDDRTKRSSADAILFYHGVSAMNIPRPLNQIWVLYMLECPYHTPGLAGVKNLFNWTATYRHDSTIVAPYEKFQYFNESVKQKEQVKNYAATKTKKVAWFVSNCGAQNDRRTYAEELAKYIQVDIYGACGSFKCPRNIAKKCFEMLNKDYKFYLAFENSNCRDYITEKLFVNGLQHDIVPIVMGAHPDDYRKIAPLNSYIHVEDFKSPKELAAYLHKLDQNNNLYNAYFKWKGMGEFINTFFWCRFCTMLHAADLYKPTWYDDLENWWRGDGICIGRDRWDHRSKVSNDGTPK